MRLVFFNLHPFYCQFLRLLYTFFFITGRLIKFNDVHLMCCCVIFGDALFDENYEKCFTKNRIKFLRMKFFSYSTFMCGDKKRKYIICCKHITLSDLKCLFLKELLRKMYLRAKLYFYFLTVISAIFKQTAVLWW